MASGLIVPPSQALGLNDPSKLFVSCKRLHPKSTAVARKIRAAYTAQELSPFDKNALLAERMRGMAQRIEQGESFSPAEASSYCYGPSDLAQKIAASARENDPTFVNELDAWLSCLGYGRKDDKYYLLARALPESWEAVLFLAPFAGQEKLEVLSRWVPQELSTLASKPFSWSHSYVDLNVSSDDSDPQRGDDGKSLGEIFGLTSLVVLLEILVVEHNMTDFSKITKGEGVLSWQYDPWYPNAPSFPWPRFCKAPGPSPDRDGKIIWRYWHNNKVELTLTMADGGTISVAHPPYPRSIEAYARR